MNYKNISFFAMALSIGTTFLMANEEIAVVTNQETVTSTPTLPSTSVTTTPVAPSSSSTPTTVTNPQGQNGVANSNAIVLPPEIKKVVESGELAAWMIESAQVAQQYVTLLDQGKYAESWDSGAKIFQRTISQPEWVTALRLARARLGGVRARSVKDQRPAWDPKGLPKGAYMVVEYNTSFDKAPNSGELLTLMREADGTWKVLTYQVN